MPLRPAACSLVLVLGLTAGPGPGGAPAARGPALDAAVDGPPARSRAFFFARARYQDTRGRSGSGAWATDYPKADIQFLVGVTRLTALDAHDQPRPVRLDQPELRLYPFLYAVEVGYMALTGAEEQGLRDYLLAGGFLVVDDFWGTAEWRRFEETMRRVLPGYPIVDLPPTHPALHVFYDIERLLQVPNVYNAMRGGPTWERDGVDPAFRGIHDTEGRLMVAINWNTDLGDAWEWAEDPRYPLEYSNFAYRMGINLILYGMSH